MVSAALIFSDFPFDCYLLMTELEALINELMILFEKLKDGFLIQRKLNEVLSPFR
jgi:hypothetical protein